MTSMTTSQDGIVNGWDTEVAFVTEACLKILHMLRFELFFVTGLMFVWLLPLAFRGKKAKRGVSMDANLPRATSQASSYNPKLPRKASSTPQTRQRPVAPLAAEPEREVHMDLVGRSSISPKEVAALVDMKPDNAQFREHEWLIPRLVGLCRREAHTAVSLFRKALAAGLDLHQVPQSTRDALFVALTTSMIRVGSLDEAASLLRNIREHGISAGTGLFSSVVKLCTSKQYFQECLAMFDVLNEDPNSGPPDRTVWSCLLFCATEAKAYDRCPVFFEKLKALDVPGQKDYSNMVRCSSVKADWKMMMKLLQEMRGHAMPVDNVIYNTALATCVSMDRVDEARELLEEMDGVGGVADVITYNTLMKGYAKSGKMAECFKIYDLMRERGLTPSQVTYGILLDGCINDSQVDRAMAVFDSMQEEGCRMNTVLYTTMIKGFAREGKVDDAMRIFGCMTKDQNVPPDLITFSVLLKANCDADRLEVALELLDAMLRLGLQPDEVIFNNLLAGCAKHGNVDLAKRLYSDMVAAGVKPSTATFSILIRLYSQSKLLDEAVEVLRVEAAFRKVELEPRLYVQLIQCCIRARQGRRAVEIYELMLQRVSPSASSNSSMLMTCVKLNMFDTAAELLDAAASKGARLDPRDANLVLEGARRKKRTQSVEWVTRSMKTMGFPVDASSNSTENAMH
eukprot:CAMPEP_0117514550 /NCGR_PEP_ID=MMETSP0784-20121206/30127_1 /TAXON_ID=39447 /ORGANISM="" /LENGTH=682 /DNA_ID=CAMNT_0005310349 /DNA_START=178 /DNA_END=2226 /DNA_ORIENTATION=-